MFRSISTKKLKAMLPEILKVSAVCLLIVKELLPLYQFVGFVGMYSFVRSQKAVDGIS